MTPGSAPGCLLLNKRLPPARKLFIGAHLKESKKAEKNGKSSLTEAKAKSHARTVKSHHSRELHKISIACSCSRHCWVLLLLRQHQTGEMPLAWLIWDYFM